MKMNSNSDLFTRSQKFIDWFGKTLFPFFQNRYGCVVLNPENLKSDKSLYVGNHSVGVLLEGFTFLYAWEKKFKQSQYCFAMAHRGFMNFPILNWMMKSFGCILASYECAEAAFKNNHSAFIFPGGNYEALRTYKEKFICDFNQSKGWIKVALKNNVSIIPVTIYGSHLVNPIFIRSRLLSYILVLPKLFRMHWVPISLAQIVCTIFMGLVTFPILSPILASVFCYFTFALSFLVPILPTELKMHIGESFDPMVFNTHQKTTEELLLDSDFLSQCYNHIQNDIQLKLDSFYKSSNS